MDAISLAEAKANLSKLVDLVEAGASIEITRGGRPVARLTSVNRPRKEIDLAELRALTATMSRPTRDAAELVRSVRDDGSY